MKATLKDNILTVEVPISEGKRSHSGKTMIAFTTKGFVDIPNTNLRININVTNKKRLTP